MKLPAFIFAAIFLVSGFAVGQEPKTFDDALKFSSQLSKPVLLEFYNENCEYCSQAAQDAINRDDIKKALARVVHFTVNFKSEQGKKLDGKFQVGIYFPVFYLLTNTGDIINRWTGYTTAPRFIEELNRALNDLTTIDQKVSRFNAQPTVDDAIFLARYYTDIWNYPKANEYFGQARKLRGGDPALYSYDILQNYANAAWQDSIPFDAVLPVADSVLVFQNNNKSTIVKTAQIMVRLARKLNETDKIGKYLKAAIAKTTGSKIQKDIEDNTLLKSEYALYIDKDMAEATRLKKIMMPANWENDPDKFYGYAKWCLERSINLDEAKALALRAVELASPGDFKSQVYNTLASICNAQNNHSDAVRYMQLAIKEDPQDEFYQKQLEEFEKKTGQ